MVGPAWDGLLALSPAALLPDLQDVTQLCACSTE